MGLVTLYEANKGFIKGNLRREGGKGRGVEAGQLESGMSNADGQCF